MLSLGSMLCSLSGCTRARRRCAAAAAGADGQREPGGARGAAAARGGRGGRARAPAHVRHCSRAGHGAAAIDAGAHPSGGPLLLRVHVMLAATAWPHPLHWICCHDWRGVQAALGSASLRLHELTHHAR